MNNKLLLSFLSFILFNSSVMGMQTFKNLLKKLNIIEDEPVLVQQQQINKDQWEKKVNQAIRQLEQSGLPVDVVEAAVQKQLKARDFIEKYNIQGEELNCLKILDTISKQANQCERECNKQDPRRLDSVCLKKCQETFNAFMDDFASKYPEKYIDRYMEMIKYVNSTPND